MTKPGYMSPSEKKKYDERKKLQADTLAKDKKTLEEKGSWVRQLGKSILGKKLSGRDLSTNPDGRNPPLPVPRPKRDKVTGGAGSDKTTSSPKKAPKLEGNRKVYAAPKPRSKREGDELKHRAAEKRAGSGSSGKSFPAGKPDGARTSGNRDVKGSLGYRIARALGDKRSESQMVADRKATEKMNKEMGR